MAGPHPAERFPYVANSCRLKSICKDGTCKISRVEVNLSSLTALDAALESTSIIISLTLRSLQDYHCYIEIISEILISPISLATSATPTDLASVSGQGSTLAATAPEIPYCITTRFGPFLRSGSTSTVDS
jgi:hypothetical protein